MGTCTATQGEGEKWVPGLMSTGGEPGFGLPWWYRNQEMGVILPLTGSKVWIRLNTGRRTSIAWVQIPQIESDPGYIMKGGDYMTPKKISAPEQESAPRAVFNTVFAILYNPAPPRDPQNPDQKRTRDDVPWVVIIPSLSIVTMVTDKDGDPVYGHVNPQYAGSFTSRLYNRLISDPDLLESYRNNPDNYDPENGYMGKMIPIQFLV